ncbi:uncharacterized protein LOC119088120 [Peromyscus leucopus]|uniref:uncharacterized protein LOC119088120 n=1 Tax=Peromyscus leucopus TaxID=10041 RepID=UPI001884A746|nr:uncharacterized protein LOC119088120 [Peromyscus leucopus]
MSEKTEELQSHVSERNESAQLLNTAVASRGRDQTRSSSGNREARRKVGRQPPGWVGGSLSVTRPCCPGPGSAHRAGPAPRPRPPPPSAPRRLPRNPSREAGTARRGRGRRAGPGPQGRGALRGVARRWSVPPGSPASAGARGFRGGPGRRAHLEHEPQQEEHRQAGDDVRVILQHEFVAQQRRVLVALLANRHGGAAAWTCRERIFKKDFEGGTLNGAEAPEKNKDQGMQKLYFPKTSRGNKAVQGMCATPSRCVFPQPDEDNAYKGMLRSAISPVQVLEAHQPLERCWNLYELGSCGRKVSSFLYHVLPP